MEIQNEVIADTINNLSDSIDTLSIEDVQIRHRRERKELQAKIQVLKKNAPKSDKKKRKEANEEVTKLEQEMDKRHAAELKQAEELSKQASQANNVPKEDSHNHKDDQDLDEDNEEEENKQPQQRVSKAQKRRDKKAREARQREEEIKACAEDALFAPKAIEARKLKEKLKLRNLVVHNVSSDGDCLFNAIRHQLILQGLGAHTVQELRNETADYIKANKESLLPYMTNPQTGDLLSDDEFKQYCDDVQNKPTWGGQIELKALSSILKVPIEVIQAEGTPTIQGMEFGGAPLTITYHRHLYSLGEHYNSTVQTDAHVNSTENDNDK